MSESIKTTSVFKIKNNVSIEAFDEGALLLKLPDRNLIEINSTALFVLEHTNGALSVAEISALMKVEYKIPSRELINDIIALYEDLENQGIIEKISSETEVSQNEG